jgi:hypothetical protein
VTGNYTLDALILTTLAIILFTVITRTIDRDE